MFNSSIFRYAQRLAMICVLLLGATMAEAGTDYYSKVKVTSSPSGAGKVYVNTKNTKEEGKTEATQTIENKTSHTYYFWAETLEGNYAFDVWKEGNTEKSTTPNFNTTVTGTNPDQTEYTFTAHFSKIIDCSVTNKDIVKVTDTKTDQFSAKLHKATNFNISVTKNDAATSDLICYISKVGDSSYNESNQSDALSAVASGRNQTVIFTIVAQTGAKKGDVFNITLTADNNARHNIVVTIYETISVTFRAPTVGLGSYTYVRDSDGETKTLSTNGRDTTVNMEVADKYTLTATGGDGYRFKKWVFAKGSDKYENPYPYSSLDGDQISAEFVENKYAIFAIKGKDGVYYNELDRALEDAYNGGGGVVYVYQSGYLVSGNYTIPANVTLLIPGDDANTVCTGDVNNERDYIANATSTCKKYLTMEANTTITVASKGAISVYAKMTYTQPHNGKPITYGRLDMGNNCHIVVQSAAVLSALGYITGDPTTSSVTIESGATVYECFQIRDWRGGTTALEVAGLSTTDILALLVSDLSVKGTDEKVFPVGQYYMQNIETKLILKAGSVEKLTTAANMSLRDYNIVMAANAPFVVPDNNNYSSGLFRLGTGTQLEKHYDREKDRQVFLIKGSNAGKQAKFGVMSLVFPVTTIATHNLTVSSEYYVLPLTNNMDVTLDMIDLTASYDLALLGDASITINKNASFIIDGGARFFVSDKEESKHMWFGASAGNATINPVYYTPANSQYLLNASGGKISSKSDTVVKDAYMYTTTAGNITKRQVNDLTDYEGDYAMKDARIVVNGKIHVKNGYLYTTASGADITSDGGGKVLYEKVDHSTTDKYYRYLQAAQGDLGIGFHAIPVTNAKLHNDETKNPEVPYSAGSEALANEEYTYVKDLGMWLTPQELIITDYEGEEFYTTLPEDIQQNVICYVETQDNTITENNFEVIYPQGGFFAKEGTILYDNTTKELTIPIKYTHQNIHNKENPYTDEQLVVKCKDLASGTYIGQPTVITLSATEDYTPKFNVVINDINYVDGSEYPLITGTGVDETTSLPIKITAENTNVAQALVTWNDKSSACTGPFTFEFGAKTDVPFASAMLTYLPTVAGEHEGTLSLTATYKDASNEVQDTTVTIKLKAKVALKQNTLQFATFPEKIYNNTPAFELIDATTNNAGSDIVVTLSQSGVVEITGSGTPSDPYMVTPVGLGSVTITAVQGASRIVDAKTIYTTITVISTDVYPVPFCVNDLDEYNKRLYSANNLNYNTTNQTVEFNSTNSASEWIFRFNGTPDKLTFTPTGSNTWSVQQRTSETDEWKNIATWTNLPTGELVSYQLEPTTSQVRIQYGSANSEVGTLSNVCVTELQIAADVEKVYIPIYANSEKKIVLTHIKNETPFITFTNEMEYSLERSDNLGTASAPYYRTTVTINTTEDTQEKTYEFTAIENGNTVVVQVNAYNFPQELPIKLATDAPANGDRYYYVTTASSYAQWDAANRQIVFQNPGVELPRSVTFAFNGAPSVIRFDVSTINGPEVVVDSVWIVEESVTGLPGTFYPTTLARDIEENNKLVQNLHYTTRYVRVTYDSKLLREIRLSNLVIEGYPKLIVHPENMMFTTSSTQQRLEALAINLQNVDFVIDNTSAFQITVDTTYESGWGDMVGATSETHETALGINKMDTIFLGVKWLGKTALDEGTITIINKANSSVLAVVPLLGSDDYLIKEYANNSGLYTGIPNGTVDANGDGEISVEEAAYKYMFHGTDYTDYKYHKVDLTNAFAADGTAMFDYLFVYGETTPASGNNITPPGTWTGDENTSYGSNAVTPLYVYKKALNADDEYMGYQFVGKIDNVNTATKSIISDVIVSDPNGVIYVDAQDKALRVYMTGFCPYATTGYNKLQEGVFLFRGKHGSKLDIYLEDFHVFSRNKTITGHAFSGKDGGEDFSDGYARGSGAVLVFENVDIQENLQDYLPFDVTIHTKGDNLLKSNYGCFYALKIDNSTAMKATQVSSPIQVHVLYRDGSDRYNERKTKTTINFDDIWPTAVDANNLITSTKRTNGYLGLKKLANNAPSIDMGNKNTIVNFNGGRIELQNSQIGSDTYKTTLAISHRSGYFGAEKGVQLCYGIGTDSVGGEVNFIDGTVTVERMFVQPAYRQYYLMDEENGEETGYTTCLRTPKNTFVRGGSVCRIRACQHVTSKGGAPKDILNGKFLGQYVYEMQDGIDTKDNETNLATVVGFPDNIEGLKLHHQNSGYQYGLNSVSPDANNKLYFWIPDGFGGVTAEQDRFMSIWKACMTEIGAGIQNVAEGSVGGDTPIEPNEEVKYFLYCQIDQNIHDVISAHNLVNGEEEYTYQAPIEVPAPARPSMGTYVRWNPNYVGEFLQHEVLSDTTYTITDRVYYITTATADVWKTFTAPFDVANIYVVESYSENELIEYGAQAPEPNDRQEILTEQAKHNADFAAFFGVAMAMGTDKSFEEIYQSYLEWAKIEDNHSDANGDYTLRGMQKLTPYFGNNWRDANFYLNENKGNWEFSAENWYTFNTRWEFLNQTDTIGGILLHKGRTYSLMFPYCPGCEMDFSERTYWDYWSGKFIIFEGVAKAQEINGSNFLDETKTDNLYSSITLSDEVPEVAVIGNSTFAMLETSAKNIYVYDDNYPAMAIECFTPLQAETTIPPTTAFLYGEVPTNKQGMPAKKVTREGRIIYGESGNNNGDPNNGTTTGSHTPTVGGDNDMFITAIDGGINIAVAAPQNIYVVNATGHILYNGYVTTNTNVLLPMNGIYVVKGQNEVQKIFF